MTVERSEVCSRCDHRRIEHEAAEYGCLKWGCRCARFKPSGANRLVMPVRPGGSE